MDEFDDEVLRTLLKLDKDSSWVTPTDIRKKMNLPKDRKDDVKNSLNAWMRPKFVKASNSPGEGYKMRSEGMNFVAQKDLEHSMRVLDASIGDLRGQQARSAAAETIFTLALLGFAAFQIVPNYNNKLIAIVAGAAVGWALLIGGPNLKQVTLNQLERIIRPLKINIIYFLYLLLAVIIILLVSSWEL